MIKIGAAALLAFRKLASPLRCFSVDNYMKTYKPHQITRHHGFFKIDEYNHFDTDVEELNKFIEKERHNFERENSKWKHITQEYYKISSSRRDDRSTSVPQRYDNYEYYLKVAWKNGREYSIIYRKPIANEQREEIVLDIMQYAQINRYHNTVELLRTSFSPSHRYVAFGVDLKNNEKVSFFIADTHHSKRQLQWFKVGNELQSRLEETNDLVFASQKQIYYTKTQSFRAGKLFYKNMETGETVEVLAEKDPQFYLGIKISKDKNFLIVSGSSKVKTKLWLIDLRSSKRELIKVWEDASKVVLNHVDSHFLLWINGQKSEIKLIKDAEFKAQMRLKSSQKEVLIKNLAGTVLHTCEEHEDIEDIDIIKDNVLLYITNINKPMLKVIRYKESLEKVEVSVSVPTLPYQFGIITPATNQNYSTEDILFSISTPFVYDETYSFSVKTGKCQLVQKYEYSGPSFQTNKYEVRHVDVPSTTEEYIPMTIIGPKKRNIGKTLVHLYGFYGISNRITYDNVSIAALQKGWTIVYAHVRGGSEKGKRWHKEAQESNRDRTWKDLQECVGYLIKEQYTHPSLLFLSTSSAGAIAAWNAINRKPHLYKAAILRFPFLDVLNSLMDSTQPLSNPDYEEFGNPIESKSVYKTLTSISPYENISAKEYPAIHIVAGENDYRTPISQIAKFSSRFRDRALQNNRFNSIGEKGLTVDISATASHLGEASVKDENYKGCDVFGYMDYLISISKDCSLEK